MPTFLKEQKYKGGKMKQIINKLKPLDCNKILTLEQEADAKQVSVLINLLTNINKYISN